MSDTHRFDKKRRISNQKKSNSKNAAVVTKFKNKHCATKTLDWTINRAKRNRKCLSCKDSVARGFLYSIAGGSVFCVNRCCIPTKFKKYPPFIKAVLTSDEVKILSVNGIKKY